MSRDHEPKARSPRKETAATAGSSPMSPRTRLVGAALKAVASAPNLSPSAASKQHGHGHGKAVTESPLSSFSAHGRRVPLDENASSPRAHGQQAPPSEVITVQQVWLSHGMETILARDGDAIEAELCASASCHEQRDGSPSSDVRDESTSPSAEDDVESSHEAAVARIAAERDEAVHEVAALRREFAHSKPSTRQSCSA